MKWGLRWKGNGWFTGYASFGPMFGGSKKEAFKFRTRRAALAATADWRMAMAVPEKLKP